MLLRAFFALFLLISCGKDDEALDTPADRLAGSWSVKEEVTVYTNRLTFATEKLPTSNYTAIVTKETATTISIRPGANSENYELLAPLTIDWAAKSISIPGAVGSGVITDENHFVVMHQSPISSGYYCDVVRTFNR